MDIKTLSVHLDNMGNVNSRNVISALLSELVKQINVNEAKNLIYILQCRVAPKFVPLEFNIAEKQLISFFSNYLSDMSFYDTYLELGDMGDAVYKVMEEKLNKKNEKYEINQLYKDLLLLANIKGKESVKLKGAQLKKIFDKLDPLSSKYIARLLSGNLRLGFSDKTILDALSIYISSDKSKSEEIERAYGVLSDLGLLAEKILIQGEDGLKLISITPGIPVASKLVEREKDVKAIWERMPNCIVQAKYDGIRCQIHKINPQNNLEHFETVTQTEMFAKKESFVKLFSRNQEELTDMFPEITNELSKFNVKSIILDSEVIGFKNGKLIPFQETMQRKRKYGIDSKQKEIPIKVMVFDILELNGKDLSRLNIEERIEMLKQVMKENESELIVLGENIYPKSENELKKIFDKYVSDGLEGIITKARGTTYDPGTRNFDWIKLKRSVDSKLNDTVDAVVLGYYKGKGVRSEFGIGTILVGIYDNDNYLTIAKVGTGFSEQQFKDIIKELEKIKLKAKPSNYLVSNNLICDVWVEPKIVVEIEADEITESENHTAKYSLRFPRIKIWGRDKKPTDSTTLVEIDEMYKMRKNVS